MVINIIIICILAILTTVLGGLFALKFKDKLHLVLGFSAGSIISLVFFDLLPEAIELGKSYSFEKIISFFIIGFIIYLVIDRHFVLCGHHEENCQNKNHQHFLSVGSLSLHNFFDGLAIGLAFHISSVVGLTIALAILIHKFSDGINTVSLILRKEGKKRTAIKWLLINSFIPILGVLFSYLISIPDNYLSIILALFGGAFLYLGGSDLLPESHHDHPQTPTTLATISGILFIYILTQFIK